VRYAQRLVAGLSHAQIKTEIFEQNIFQVTRPSSIKRMYSELSKRMTMFSEAEYTLLAEGTDAEQRALLWVAACRQYPFIAAFARATRDRYAAYLRDMPVGEYHYLYEQLAAHHHNLTTITEATRTKLRTVTYKMAVDAGILTATKEIRGFSLPPHVRDVLSHDDDVLYFPG
jgi:hypothetical protein